MGHLLIDLYHLEGALVFLSIHSILLGSLQTPSAGDPLYSAAPRDGYTSCALLEAAILWAALSSLSSLYSKHVAEDSLGVPVIEATTHRCRCPPMAEWLAPKVCLFVGGLQGQKEWEVPAVRHLLQPRGQTGFLGGSWVTWSIVCSVPRGIQQSSGSQKTFGNTWSCHVWGRGRMLLASPESKQLSIRQFTEQTPCSKTVSVPKYQSNLN